MKIFLDENVPHKLTDALRALGHDVESVQTLHIKGIKNGELYRRIQDYDLCFTRDEEFARSSSTSLLQGKVKVLRVTLKQRPQDAYIVEFLTHFIRTDWEQYKNGDNWP